MIRLLYGIFVLALLSCTSSEDCLDYTKFFQQCIEDKHGKHIFIAHAEEGCKKYFHCLNKKISVEGCFQNGGRLYVVTSDDGLCSHPKNDFKCRRPCPSTSIGFEQISGCAKSGTPFGNYADGCKSYYECKISQREAHVTLKQCGTDSSKNQKYFNTGKGDPCGGTAGKNSCTEK